MKVDSENPMVFSEITVGISCKGNIQALCLSLSSVLVAAFKPKFVQIRLEGKFPEISNFYLAQLTDLARMFGILVRISVCKSEGVRASRDWQLQTCKTKYLWMLDDDVVVSAYALEAYNSISKMVEAPWTFLSGSKPDVNNRRNYPVFDTVPIRRLPPNQVNHNHSLVYSPETFGQAAPTVTLDTGNVLFDLTEIRKKNLSFKVCEEHRNSSGDATTFWLQLQAEGLKGYFVPAAIAYHLEKAGGGFNEFEARAEMLLRLCDLKGWDKGSLKECFMPGTW